MRLSANCRCPERRSNEAPLPVTWVAGMGGGGQDVVLVSGMGWLGWHSGCRVRCRLAERGSPVQAVLLPAWTDLPPVARTPPVWGQTLGSGGR